VEKVIKEELEKRNILISPKLIEAFEAACKRISGLKTGDGEA
jgi:hypothetical protein